MENEIGTARLKTALDWDKILDPIYTGAEPSKLELQDVFLLREAMELYNFDIKLPTDNVSIIAKRCKILFFLALFSSL